jgi:hypothetical protein
MTKYLRMATFMAFASLLAFASSTALAQYSGSLSGTVTDPSGGIIPGATVTLTNEGTHVAATRTAAADGVFEFPSLPGGQYNLSVTAKGFKVGSYQNIAILEGSPRNIDVTLGIGGASETVTVDANDVPALQTADASVNTTLDAQQFEKVPSYGRDPYNLVRTAPGITGDASRAGNGTAVFLPNSVGPGGSNFGVAATENTVQISSDGQRITDNNFLVDGVSVNSLGYGGATVINPNIEAIGSMQIISTSFSAEDGRNSGAQIKITTKTGTNQIHGSAFFQYDEPGLNAYNKYGGVPGSGALPVRVATKGRDYAASLGGPIIRDKLFAFASFEGLSQKLESFTNDFIETPQFRAQIHSLRPGSIADQIVNAPGGIPVIRNVLTQSCLTPANQLGYNPASPPANPASLALCQVVPGGLDIGSPVPLTANTGSGYASFNVGQQIQVGGPNGTPGLPSAVPTSSLDGIPDIEYVQLDASQHAVARQYNGRLDWNLGPKDLLAGSAYVTKLYRITPSDTARPNQNLPFDPTNIATTLIYIHTFSSSLLNDFRANYTLFSENGVYDAAQHNVNFGIPFIELQNSNYTTNNRIHFGANAGTTSPGIFAENQYELRDTVTKIFGSHVLKMGFEARTEQDNSNLVGGARPTYTFAGIWNFFNDRPIYEGISANPATGGQPNVSRHLDDHYFSGFVQHDWKVNPNFTVNTGLRYEYFGPLYNKGFEINYPKLGTTPGRELVDASLTPRNNLWNAQYHDFSPKLGFAWTPEELKGKTVLRGGFAMAYNRLDDVLFDPSLEDGPGVFSYGICCGTAPQDFGTPFVGGQIVYQLGSSTAYNSYAPNPALKTPIGANGLPTNGIAIEAYGASPRLPQPYSYLYSLEIQNDLGHNFVVSAGYQGSTGRHYSRLVNQLFTRPTSVVTGGVTTSTGFGNGLYIAQDDSNQYYNGLNIHATKRYKKGLSIEATYTWSKSEDQVSSGDGADGNANQTDPGNNASELGPSDFDVRHRIVALGTWDLAYYHGDNYLLKSALNGWQFNGIFTAHTGFPFTPVTYGINGIPVTPTSATISPIRPNSYIGNNTATCSNDAFRNGSAITGTFGVTDNGHGNLPAIGRNSFRGPCYQDIDLGIAKEVKIPVFGERGTFRFQAQAFNLINKLNFSPFTFNSQATQIPTSVVTPGSATTFGRPVSASAGRVIEFNARVNF